MQICIIGYFYKEIIRILRLNIMLLKKLSCLVLKSRIRISTVLSISVQI